MKNQETKKTAKGDLPNRFTNILWKGEEAEKPQLIKALLRDAGYKDLNNQKDAIKIAVGLVCDWLRKDPDFIQKANSKKINQDSGSEESGDPLF